MGTNAFHRLRTPSTACRRSPSLDEGGMGGASRALSKFLIQPRVQGRNPARLNGGYGVPRGFKGGSKPSAPCGRLSEAEHPKRKGATLLRPLSAVNSKFPPNPLGLAERVHRPQTMIPPRSPTPHSSCEFGFFFICFICPKHMMFFFKNHQVSFRRMSRSSAWVYGESTSHSSALMRRMPS